MKRPSRSNLLWLIPLLFLAIFFFYPLSAILIKAFQASPLLKGTLLQQVLKPFAFTFGQAFLSAFLTLLIGLPSAFLFVRFSFPGKTFLRILTTVPFILPTVVVAASFNALLGPRGWVNTILMAIFRLSTPPIAFMNTLSAILLAHIFYNTTIVIRVIGSAWSTLNPRLEQAARSLGASPWKTFWQVTFPLLLPSIFSAMLLVFLFDFTSFGVILILGGPGFSTLETEAYLQVLHLLNLPMAALLSAIQLGSTLTMTILIMKLSSQWNLSLSPKLNREDVRPAKSFKSRVFVIAMTIFLAVLFVLPLISLASRSLIQLDNHPAKTNEESPTFTTRYYQELFINRRSSLFYVSPINAVGNSLLYGGLTAIISLSLGMITVFTLRRRTPGERLLEPLIMLPLGASAVTLGLGFILVFSHPPLDIRSFPLLIPIVHSLVAFPFVVRTLQPAFASIPGSLHDAAATLGASPMQIFKEIDLPIMTRAILVSGIFAFAISLGEFGATIFLVRPEFPTIPIAIYRFLSQPGALNYGQAMAMATILAGLCAVCIYLIECLDR